LLGSLHGEVASAQRQVSFYPADLVSGYHARRQLALPSSRVTCWLHALLCDPGGASSTCPDALKLLPSHIGDRVGFPTFRWWLSSWTTTFFIFGAQSHGLLPRYSRPRTHHY